MDPADPHDLKRFVDAQARVIDAVLAELVAGEKRSHWMWFIFPQLRGLGRSTMAALYGIGSLAEARAYLAHPILGARLRECTRLVLAVQGYPLPRILPPPDDMKFGSSMTLFAQAAPEEPLFRDALERHFGGRPDERTLALLSSSG